MIKHAKFGWKHNWSTWDKVYAIPEYVLREVTEFVDESGFYENSWYAQYINKPELIKDIDLLNGHFQEYDIQKVHIYGKIKHIIKWKSAYVEKSSR